MPDFHRAASKTRGRSRLDEWNCELDGLHNFSDAIATSFGGSKTAIPEEYKKRSAGLWPERFTMPVGITASGQDYTVPPQSVLRLANTLKAQGRGVMLIYRPQSGHSTTYDDANAIIEFVIQKARS